MKLLFLTTYNVPIEVEHYFTINVWKGLCEEFTQDSSDILAIATILEVPQKIDSHIKEEACNERISYKLYYSSFLSDEEKIREIVHFFRYIAPDVIHSNMIDVIDVAAAKICNIPIVLTIHIGGFICPRSGGNGFLKYDDSICNDKVGRHCLRCCSQDLPFPFLTSLLYQLIPGAIREWAYQKLKDKHIFYVTEFLIKSHDEVKRKKAIEIYKYATIIAANQHLKDLLALNGLTDNVILLPHGVEPRQRLPFPEIEDVVKFFYLGRIQYAKGLHNLMKAFKGINNSLYELHIIGDAEQSRRTLRYDKYIRRLAIGKNVYFHGRLHNSEIESVINDMHVMIHPANFLEVYGISIAESLSIGRPVLATRCGGSEMQVQDGVNGWLVPSNNIVALHDKVVDIIQHKEQIEKMSEKCSLPHALTTYCMNLISIYNSKIKNY